MRLIGWALTLIFTFIMIIDCVLWVFPVYTISSNGSSSMYFIKVTDTSTNIQVKVGMWGLCALTDSGSESSTVVIDSITSTSGSESTSSTSTKATTTSKGRRWTVETDDIPHTATILTPRSLVTPASTPAPTALPVIHKFKKRDNGSWKCTSATLGLDFTNDDLTNANVPILGTVQAAFDSTSEGVRKALVLNVVALCMSILCVAVRAVIYLFQGQGSDQDHRAAIEIRRRVQAIGLIAVLIPTFLISFLAWIFNAAVFGSAKSKLAESFQTEINVAPIILSVIASLLSMVSLWYEYMVLRQCNVNISLADKGMLDLEERPPEKSQPPFPSQMVNQNKNRNVSNDSDLDNADSDDSDDSDDSVESVTMDSVYHDPDRKTLVKIPKSAQYSTSPAPPPGETKFHESSYAGKNGSILDELSPADVKKSMAMTRSARSPQSRQGPDRDSRMGSPDPKRRGRGGNGRDTRITRRSEATKGRRPVTPADSRRSEFSYAPSKGRSVSPYRSEYSNMPPSKRSESPYSNPSNRARNPRRPPPLPSNSRYY